VKSTQSIFSPLTSTAYAAMRVVFGLLFVMHGLQKLLGLFGGSQVQLMSRLGAAGLIETAGGALIAVGLFTSIVAFITSGEMAFAYFLVHAPRGPWPIQNGGEPAVLYCFVFLYIATRGGGRLSLDSLRR
jgi:putative oxidoreductase